MAAPRADWRPHPTVLRITAYAACLVVIGVASGYVIDLLGRLGIVFFPLVTATFLTRILAVPSRWLQRRGWRSGPSAALCLVGFLVLLVVSGFVVVRPMVDEADTLGDTLSEGTEQVEDWLVEDSAFDIQRSDIEDFKDDVGKRSRTTIENSTDTIARGARLIIEVLVGLVFALVLTFFGLKDGEQIHGRVLQSLPERYREPARQVSHSAWHTLGGYLRGAALLGVLEAAIIGAAMGLTGAHLVLPMMLLTFLAAFIPLVGATVAGVIAVLVTLASAGLSQALIVAVVALLVQQFDNELLAPWIYGKALELHPVVILISIAGGTALFGFAGTLLAVPVVGVAINALGVLRGEPVLVPADDGAEPPPDVDGGALPAT